MPRQQVLDNRGAVAVYKPDGTSSLQPYVAPAYMYLQNGSAFQTISPVSIANIIFDALAIKTRYNITVINSNTPTCAFQMPIGTYLVNFNCNMTSTLVDATSGMYVSVNGSQLTNVADAPYFTSFNQAAGTAI